MSPGRDGGREYRMVVNAPSRTLQGGTMIIGAMAVIGLIDNFVVVISQEAGLWQFHFIRSLIGCAVLVTFCRLTGRRLVPANPGAVLLRSCLVAVAMVLYFGSLAVMPIAEAGSALFTSPIFILVFSVLFFRTRVGPIRVIAVAVGFAGVLLVLRPDPANLRLASLFPLFAGMFYGLGQLVTRHRCAGEDTAVLLLWFLAILGTVGFAGSVLFSLVSVPDSWMAAAPFFVTGWVPPTERFLIWTAIQSAGSLIAVSGLIRGYQVADPTLVAVFEYSFLLFGGFWGWMLWQQVPDSLDVIGILAVVVAGCLIAIRNR
ncbi:MAG: DMT family transporter [Paracoccaceae bacterium]|nr:DMT family transporter [Paracoccaceae bacterium]